MVKIQATLHAARPSFRHEVQVCQRIACTPSPACGPSHSHPPHLRSVPDWCAYRTPLAVHGAPLDAGQPLLRRHGPDRQVHLYAEEGRAHLRHARRSRLHDGQVREPPGVVDGPGPLPDHLAHPPQDPRAEPWVWRAPHAGGRLARAVAALSAFGACWHSLPRPAEAWGVGGGHQGSRARGGRTQPKGGAAHGAHRREGDP
mmetsp:Transcript_26631/g.71155  ORF Transcript_26631/g.71155 Transcript_26631/m.71155 type:complete len:201 (-) Transcript_26631:3578-4180(-)